MKYLHLDRRGSITLEAAIALPFYTFALIALISFMQMIRLNSSINFECYRAGKEVALYSYGEELLDIIPEPHIKNLVATSLSEGYCKKLINNKINSDYIFNKILDEDISLLRTTIKAGGNKEDIVDFVATYKEKPFCNFLGLSSHKIISRARLHPWTGYTRDDAYDDEKDRIVYITETGTVYHLTKSCTYLDLSISSIPSGNISSTKNASGSHYNPCDKCASSKASPSTTHYFITSYGDAYHTSLSCSSLKRTIIEISIKEVGDRKACSRCGGGL